MKLSVKSFALTCGILFGVGFMLATWWLIAWETPGDIMRKFSSFFIGYSFTYVGGLLGLVWAFVYGFVIGGLFAWLYNKLTGSKKAAE
jgi:F0F1-type ATP synthase membrane subunit c/vacuolar-type H+-ATPase subunit K